MIDFESMTRNELILYLYSFIEGMLKVGPESEDELDFIRLQRKVIFELMHNKVYCVKSTRYKPTAPYGKIDFDVMYFSSLHQAKRELKFRRQLMEERLPLAEPWEVSTSLLKDSLAPDDYRSIIDNRSVKLDHPGRFKFVEGRLRVGRTKNGDPKIAPYLLSLTEVPLVGAQFSGWKNATPKQESPDLAGKKVISFLAAQQHAQTDPRRK